MLESRHARKPITLHQNSQNTGTLPPVSQTVDNRLSKPKGPSNALRKAVQKHNQFEADLNPQPQDDALVWEPQRGSQYAFHQNPDTFELLYGGAAGGGKSDSLLMEALRHVDIPGYRAILFRRTYPELEKSLVPRAYEILYGQAKPVNKGTEWTFRNGAVLYLSHLQHEEDKEKHKSAEYDFEGFDELTSFSESQYVYLFSRCRGKNANIPRRIRASTNPTGIGHSWVKKRFVDMDPNDVKPYARIPYEFAYGWRVNSQVFTTFSDLPDDYVKGEPAFRDDKYIEYKEVKSGLTRAFIPALLWGNQKLLKADPQYVRRLRALPITQQRALLYGEWDVFEGQFFSEWDPNVHVVDPFPIPDNWEKFCGIDYGFHDPMSCLWFAADETGKVYVYRELYGAKMSPSQQAESILTLGQGEEIAQYAADPSMWQHRGGESFAEIYDRVTNGNLVLTKSNNSRPAGWAIIHEMLLNGQLFIFSNCKNLIRTLPSLNHDRKNPDDLDCFVAGTKVIAKTGTKNVEDVKVGDYLWTPIGYRKVTVAEVSGEGEVYRVDLSNGEYLEGTPDHRVFVEGEGLVELQLLKCGMILGTKNTTYLPLWSFLLWSTRAFVIPALKIVTTTRRTAHTLRMARHRFIARCTSTLSEKFPKAFKFTTKTITSTTMRLKTLRQSLGLIMPATTSQNDSQIPRQNPNIISGTTLRAKSSFERTLKRCYAIGQYVTLRANIVEQLLRRSHGSRNSATPTVSTSGGWPTRQASNALCALRRFLALIKRSSPVHIVAGGISDAQKKVYSITVEEAHLYYANGVLVTNTLQEDHCCDALRYGLLTYRGYNALPEKTPDGDAIPEWWNRLQKNKKFQKYSSRVHL